MGSIKRPDEDCESCPNAYRLVKNVDLEYLRDVRQVGGRLFFGDTDLISGTTYQYRSAESKAAVLLSE